MPAAAYVSARKGSLQSVCLLFPYRNSTDLGITQLSGENNPYRLSFYNFYFQHCSGFPMHTAPPPWIPCGENDTRWKRVVIRFLKLSEAGHGAYTPFPYFLPRFPVIICPAACRDFFLHNFCPARQVVRFLDASRGMLFPVLFPLPSAFFSSFLVSVPCFLPAFSPSIFIFLRIFSRIFSQLPAFFQFPSRADRFLRSPDF